MISHEPKSPVEVSSAGSLQAVQPRRRKDSRHPQRPAQPDPRAIAAVVLERSEVTSVAAAKVLPSVLRRFPQFTERQRCLTTELVYTAVRMRRRVEGQLSAHALGGLPVDTTLLAHLIVAATEILYFDPRRASGMKAIDVAVAQVQALRTPKMAGIVSGILSRLLASQGPIDPDGQDTATSRRRHVPDTSEAQEF